MKYKKAKVEIIHFEGMDIFMATSGERAALNDLIGPDCSGFNGVSADGSFHCKPFGSGGTFSTDDYTFYNPYYWSQDDAGEWTCTEWS